MQSGPSSRRVPPRLGGGRFVVCDNLGDGGTSGVYLAWDADHRQWVALKALLHTHLKDQQMIQRFRAEAATMARLEHPNIARILFHDMDATPPYLVMDLARCGSAMAWVKQNGPMPTGLAVDVMAQMCEALSQAHDQGVIHRDIKPHNFLLDDEGVCKLTDFGIARVDDTTSMTATGSQIGTFSFMAPEQRSDTKRVDLRADIYSLGASFYTLITARTSAELFIAEDEDGILEKVPPPFRPVIVRACQYAADDRYQDVRSFQTALLAAQSQLPSDQRAVPDLLRPSGPLPDGPPPFLAKHVDVDDLNRSLGMSLDTPTYVPKAGAGFTGNTGNTGNSGSGLSGGAGWRPGGAFGAPSSTSPFGAPETTGGFGSPNASGGRSGGGGALSRAGRSGTPPRPSYQMSSASSEGSAADRIASSSIPSYLDEAEAAREARRESAMKAARAEEAQRAIDAEKRRREEAAAAAEGETDSRAPIVAGALVAAFVLMLLVLVGSGVMLVGGAAASTTLARDQFTQALQAESAVVYDVGGDREFEGMYAEYAEARGAEKLTRAIAFADALERKVASTPPGDATAQARVQRILAARDDYVAAHEAWEGTASGFPGVIAVTVGLAPSP